MVHMPRPLLDFQHPVEKSKEDQCKSAAEEYERTGPEILVDREPEIPNLTSYETHNSSA